MRLLQFDQTMKKGILAGAVLGVLTAAVIGAGSAAGAQTENTASAQTGNTAGAQTGNIAGAQAGNTAGAAGGIWRQDFDGYTRYYGPDGMVLTNTITPDGQYVDGTGVFRPASYDVSELASIPEDAKSLMVIEGYGTAARASFYIKEEIPDTQGDLSGPGAEGQQKTSVRWNKITDSGCYVGRNGIGKEREGDEKSPRGLYSLDQAFGTQPDPGNFSVPYLQVDDGHYWVGDNDSPYYNTMVNIRETGNVFRTGASEHLSTYGGKAYRYCMAIGYNKERTPYKGSAIFLHCMDGPGTGGCVAVPEDVMVTVLQRIQQPAYILIDDGDKIKDN